MDNKRHECAAVKRLIALISVTALLALSPHTSGVAGSAGCAISRLYDRVTGGTIDADKDDPEFDSIITEVDAL